MVWNPLDWSGDSFFFLFFFMAVSLFFYGLYSRSRLGPERPPYQRLTELELAYLAGGPNRVGDMLLLGLLRGKGATITPKDLKITVSDKSLLVPLVGETVAVEFQPEMRRSQFQGAIAPIVKQLENRMRLLGLSPTVHDMVSFMGAMAVPYGLLMLFGIVKMLIGSGRGHPVGILLVLLVFTALSALFLATRPRRTWAGAEVLRSYLAQNARAARAPLDHELLLALALSGTYILSGTAYAEVHAAARTLSSSGSGDSGGCGGDSDSSGGGGDGGGGCGGGGCGGCS